MKTKLHLLIAIVLISCGKYEDPSKQETKIEDIRLWKNPSNDIQAKYVNHVNELVSKSAAKKEQADDLSYTLNYLDKETMKLLNARELLYYCLAYPAAFDQNCSMDAGDTLKTKIARYLPDQFCAHHTSNIQTTLLERNRDSVIMLLNEYIKKHPGKTDVAYLTLVRDLQAIECIPAVIETASPENTCNYTLLTNLLVGYRSFMATGIYSKLYKDENTTRNVRIDASPENVKRICDLAMQMYNEQKIQ